MSHMEAEIIKEKVFFFSSNSLQQVRNIDHTHRVNTLIFFPLLMYKYRCITLVWMESCSMNVNLSRYLDVYSTHLSPPAASGTLLREPFRYRHRHSPAGDLSDKIIHTLRRNLESYVR